MSDGNPTSSTTINNNNIKFGISDDDMIQQQIEAAIDLPICLHVTTKFAFCAYAATIMQLDFVEDWGREFCLSVLNLLVKHFRLDFDSTEIDGASPSSSKVHEVYECFEPPNSKNRSIDIVEFIQDIKSDPFIQQNGVLTIIVDLITIFLKTGCYDARYRILLKHMCAFLAVSWDDVQRCEEGVVHLLEQATSTESEATHGSPEDAKCRKQREKVKKLKRYLMIGAGSAVGGVLIGLTGGLAAPIFAGGVAMLAGSAAAAGIATTAGAAILGSVFGVAGAGLAGYKMNRRVGAIEEFSIETLSRGKSLHISLVVSGWITEENEDSFRSAWRNLDASAEQYCLRYESKYLLQLGQAFDYIMTFAVSYAIQQTLMETALAGIVSALAWPLSILTVGNVVDNPWNVGVRRATEVGEHLAHLLLSRQHGNRPITLMGFSLGARVVYHCLLEMTKYDQKAVGLVEDVVLLGAPVTGSPGDWKKVSSVVAGRVINGYCSTDWMLKFLYRTMNVQATIAGTAPVVTGCPKIVNVNLSHIVQGHNDYLQKLSEILKAVGVKVAPEKETSFSNGEKGNGTDTGTNG